MENRSSRNPWLMMASNNAWANATLHAAIADLPPGAFIAPRPGFFPSLSGTLNHIYEIDLYYLDALEGGGLGRSVYDREEIREPAELARLQAEADARLIAFCRDITPETLKMSVATERNEGPVMENVASLILHLIQHQIHHRGQAHVQMSDAGVSPPQLDDFYLDHGRVPSAAAYW